MIEMAAHRCFHLSMKQLSRLVLLAVAAGTIACLVSCTPSETGDGTTSGFYGPSTANTPNYTEQLRSEFRNNW